MLFFISPGAIGAMQIKVVLHVSCVTVFLESKLLHWATQVLDHGQRRRLRGARKPGNQWMELGASDVERCRDLPGLR